MISIVNVIALNAITFAITAKNGVIHVKLLAKPFYECMHLRINSKLRNALRTLREFKLERNFSAVLGFCIRHSTLEDDPRMILLVDQAIASFLWNFLQF